MNPEQLRKPLAQTLGAHQGVTEDPHKILQDRLAKERRQEKDRQLGPESKDLNVGYGDSGSRRTAWRSRLDKHTSLSVNPATKYQLADFLGILEHNHPGYAEEFFEWMANLPSEYHVTAANLAPQFSHRQTDLKAICDFLRTMKSREEKFRYRELRRGHPEEELDNQVHLHHLESLATRASNIQLRSRRK